MFCPNCGVEVNETDNFCYNCGHKLEFKKAVKAFGGSESSKAISGRADRTGNGKKSKGKTKRKVEIIESEETEEITGERVEKLGRREIGDIKVKLNCSIQGMNKKFKPNGSYNSYNLGKVTVEEALEYLRMMPRKQDFPAKVLRGLKSGEDVCPPALIFSNDYTLNVATSNGETIEVVSFDFKELAGYRFENKGLTLDMVEVDREEAERIVIDFFRKVDRIKKLRLGVSPLEYSVLMAVGNGVSNSNVIASITGVSVSEVRDAIRKLIDRGLIIVRKKGLIRRKYWYELSADGERKLSNGKRKIEKAVKEDKDLVDALAVPLFMMFALNDPPDGIDASEISDAIGDADTFDVNISEADFSDAAYDTDVDVGDSGWDGGDGDWGDGDIDGF